MMKIQVCCSRVAAMINAGRAMLQYKEADRPSMMEVLDFEYFKTAAHEPRGCGRGQLTRLI